MSTDPIEPYAPPGVLAAPEGRAPSASLASRTWEKLTPWRLFLVSIVVVVITVPTASFIESSLGSALAPWALGLATGLALLGGARALGGFAAQLFLGKLSIQTAVSLVLAAFANGTLGFFGYVLTLLSTGDFRRGRQIRSFGQVLLPKVIPGAWTTIEFVPTPAPAGVALRWVDNARTEHASVAAFAQLTLDLMVLGAPPDLLKATHEDALDEIRHTELCFALARALGAEASSPASFPEARPKVQMPRSRNVALAQLAVDSLIDGALHEGVSARVVARLARRCSKPMISDVLREIARDEGRHAAHGWDVVRFCLEQGGAPVARALLGAILGLPDTHPGVTNELGGADGSWEVWGLPGRALEEEEYKKAASEIKVRVRTLVAQFGLGRTAGTEEEEASRRRTGTAA